jgi:hypothetical protein
MQHDGSHALHAYSLTCFDPSSLSAWLALLVRRLAQTGVGHTATPKGLVLPLSSRGARSRRGRELTAAGNFCLLLFFLAWPDRFLICHPMPEAQARRAVKPPGQGFGLPSYGFVHCFPLGATAVLTLALCINQLRPPKHRPPSRPMINANTTSSRPLPTPWFSLQHHSPSRF